MNQKLTKKQLDLDPEFYRIAAYELIDCGYGFCCNEIMNAGGKYEHIDLFVEYFKPEDCGESSVWFTGPYPNHKERADANIHRIFALLFMADILESEQQELSCLLNSHATPNS